MNTLPAFSSLAELPAWLAKRYGGTPALSTTGDAAPLSCADLKDRAQTIAQRLMVKEFKSESVVVLRLQAGPGWVASLLAIWQADLVALPVPVTAPVEEVLRLAECAAAEAVLLGRRNAAERQTFSRYAVFVAGEWAAVEQETGQAPASRPEGRALLIPTSGSTAAPRLVELTHTNLLANLRALLGVRRAEPGQAFLSMLPPTHLFELVCGILAPLCCGARVVFAATLLPNRLLDQIRESGITHALAVPALLETLYLQVLEDLVDLNVLDASQRDQSIQDTAAQMADLQAAGTLRLLRRRVRERTGDSLQRLIVGGAGLPPAWGTVLGGLGFELEVGYGLTEAGPIVSRGLVTECPPRSVGKPLAAAQIQIAQDGEILVRGPGVMRGYRQEAEATRTALRHGWLHTGDRGRLDAAGFLYVDGRLKESAVTANGETVALEEFEQYYASRLFRDYSVVLRRHHDGNDRPLLVVVPATGVSPTAVKSEFQKLRSCGPDRCWIADCVVHPGPLPRTSLGKIQRRQLAAGLLTVNPMRNET